MSHKLSWIQTCVVKNSRECGASVVLLQPQLHRSSRHLETGSGVLQDIVEEMAEEKAAHIRYLRNVLGDAAPPCPAMDIGPAFVAAADAAVGMTLDPPFDPYADDTLFLHGAFLLQDIFATAYVGGSESGESAACCGTALSSA